VKTRGFRVGYCDVANESMVWYSQLEYPSLCCIDMGSEHVTAIDVKTIPNRDERRSVGFGTNAARRGAGQSRA
jgi:hypothetical protein